MRSAPPVSLLCVSYLRLGLGMVLGHRLAGVGPGSVGLGTP